MAPSVWLICVCAMCAKIKKTPLNISFKWRIKSYCCIVIIISQWVCCDAHHSICHPLFISRHSNLIRAQSLPFVKTDALALYFLFLFFLLFLIHMHKKYRSRFMFTAFMELQFHMYVLPLLYADSVLSRSVGRGIDRITVLLRCKRAKQQK